MKNKIKSFLEAAYDSCENGFSGCWHLNLEDYLYLVVANYDDSICAKIAYNVDDLQSDYELDWYMPTYIDGEIANTELSLSKYNLESDAEWFYKEFKGMMKEIKAGKLLLDI